MILIIKYYNNIYKDKKMKVGGGLENKEVMDGTLQLMIQNKKDKLKFHVNFLEIYLLIN